MLMLKSTICDTGWASCSISVVGWYYSCNQWCWIQSWVCHFIKEHFSLLYFAELCFAVCSWDGIHVGSTEKRKSQQHVCSVPSWAGCF